jgi:outer membrane protein OmpA-like peptidoglycan-associated protein
LALIASNRENDDNGLDIYSFELHQEARPGYVSYIVGIVSDAKTKIPVQATIELIDLNTGEQISQPESQAETGQYLLCLPAERDYMLNISKEGYLPYSGHFALGNKSKQEPLRKDIELQPIELNANFVLKNIFFELDSYELKSESKFELGKLIEFLNKNKNVSIEISGHTDNQGSKEHNLKLSKNRAKTVYDYLINNQISDLRLKYKGYGFEKPIDTNETPEGRANNRRTEFKIIKI